MKSEMTSHEAEVSKGRAARFAHYVLEDDDLADSIADESLSDWADRKHILLIDNPPRHNKGRAGLKPLNTRSNKIMATATTTVSRLKRRILELEEDVANYEEERDQLLGILSPEDDDSEDDDTDSEDDDE